jgi:hypothetical protein
MISARSRARTRRFLLIGLMLSFMVHLVGGSLYGLLARVMPVPQWASKQQREIAKSDIITIEQAQPTPAPAAPAPPKVHTAAPPPPAPKEAPVPIPAAAEQPHEIAHITKHAPAQAAPSKGHATAKVQIFRPAVGPKEPNRPYYDEQQVAQMNSAFEKAISDSHQTAQQANAAMAQAPVITSMHMQMQVQGIHEGMNPGDGIITVIKSQRIGKTMWYWTHYEYMYGDGHVEEGDIPWPFHFGPGEHDPFASHDRRVAIQEPPADFKQPPDLKPQLLQFFGGPQVR